MTDRSKVRTCLWFDKHGLEAASFHVSLLPSSAIDTVHPHGKPDELMIVEFSLDCAPMMIMTAGPHYALTLAASISVLMASQDETD